MIIVNGFNLVALILFSIVKLNLLSEIKPLPQWEIDNDRDFMSSINPLLSLMNTLYTPGSRGTPMLRDKTSPLKSSFK